MGYVHKKAERGGPHLTEQLFSIASGSDALRLVYVCVCACVCVYVCVCVRVFVREGVYVLACVSTAPHLPLVTAPLGSELRLS